MMPSSVIMWYSIQLARSNHDRTSKPLPSTISSADVCMHVVSSPGWGLGTRLVCMRQIRAWLDRIQPSAKLKSANIFVLAGWGQSAKFNACQLFRLYGILYLQTKRSHDRLSPASELSSHGSVWSTYTATQYIPVSTFLFDLIAIQQASRQSVCIIAAIRQVLYSTVTMETMGYKNRYEPIPRFVSIYMQKHESRGQSTLLRALPSGLVFLYAYKCRDRFITITKSPTAPCI